VLKKSCPGHYSLGLAFTSYVPSDSLDREKTPHSLDEAANYGKIKEFESLV
jgi:hypothetical protein